MYVYSRVIWFINVTFEMITSDDPLISFTGKRYSPVVDQLANEDEQVDTALVKSDAVQIGGVEIGFHRSVQLTKSAVGR